MLTCHAFESCRIRQEAQNVRRVCIKAGLVRQQVQDAAAAPADDARAELAERIIDLSHQLTDALDQPALADGVADLRLLNAVRDGLGSLQYSLLLLEYKHDRAPYAAPVPPPLDTLVGAPASQEQRDYRWEHFDKSCDVYRAARRLWKGS